jgi:hypothetical protein
VIFVLSDSSIMKKIGVKKVFLADWGGATASTTPHPTEDKKSAD